MFAKVLSILKTLLSLFSVKDRKAIPEVKHTAAEVHKRLIEVLEHEPHHVLLAAIPTDIGMDLNALSEQMDKYWAKNLNVPITATTKEWEGRSMQTEIHFGQQFEVLLDIVSMRIYSSMDADDPIISIQVETMGKRVLDLDYAVSPVGLDSNVHLILRAVATKTYANASTLLQTIRLLMKGN